jgi:hypothetical protein
VQVVPLNKEFNYHVHNYDKFSCHTNSDGTNVKGTKLTIGG